MKNTMVIFVIVAWLVVIYFGFISMVGKTMKTAEPPQKDATAEFKKQQEIRQQLQDLKDRQKRLLEQRQDKMRR